MANDHKYAVGDKVRILREIHGHSFPVGEIVKIVDIDEDDDPSPYKATYLDGHDYWYLGDDEIEPEDEVVLRASDLPKATFIGDSVSVGIYSWKYGEPTVEYALALVAAMHVLKTHVPTVEERLTEIAGRSAAEDILAKFDVTLKA